VSRALFVFDRENWCSVLQGPEQAAVALEAADVDADEYAAFDERGTVFRLWTAGEEVRVEATPERDADELLARLRHPRWLARRLHGTMPPSL
jgi:hypothetical protein